MPDSPTFIVLAFDHPLRAVESVANQMATGLLAMGVNTMVACVPRDIDLLAKLQPSHVCGVLSLGPMPLSVCIGGQQLWRHFTCPVSIYQLDAPIYDLARVAVMNEFLADARLDQRLGLVSPERGYRDWLQPTLGIRWDYLPFAAFPRLTPDDVLPPAQSKVAVIGTIGSELGGSPLQETLPSLIARLLGQQVSVGAQRRVIDALNSSDAHALPALSLSQALDWSIDEVLSPRGLCASIAIDSFIKRRRRIDALRSLIGVPVDFYGTGWSEVLGPIDGFCHVGKIHHDDIALVLSHYRAVLNFDPNWQGGVHDRVLTAAAMGVTVLTNSNTGLDEAALPPELLVTYNPNRPDLAALVAARGIFDGPMRHNLPRIDVLEKHNWGIRMAQWITATRAAKAALQPSNTALFLNA